MEIVFGFDGSLLIKDNTGNRHLFDTEETKELETAVYKWVQKRKRYKNLMAMEV